jgi:hypothetical protein
MNRTPRQQIEAQFQELIDQCDSYRCNMPHSPKEHVDATIAVFKGLPAMQEVPEEGGYIAPIHNQTVRRILAELEGLTT